MGDEAPQLRHTLNLGRQPIRLARAPDAAPIAECPGLPSPVGDDAEGHVAEQNVDGLARPGPAQTSQTRQGCQIQALLAKTSLGGGRLVLGDDASTGGSREKMAAAQAQPIHDRLVLRVG